MTSWRMIPAAVAVAVAVCIAFPAQAQTTGTAPPSGIGLTPEHKRTIYREIGAENLPPTAHTPSVAIGEEIPDSIMLIEMPVAVKDKIGLLRDFKFAKLANEAIVIVDPAQRRVVDMVTKEDAAR